MKRAPWIRARTVARLRPLVLSTLMTLGLIACNGIEPTEPAEEGVTSVDDNPTHLDGVAESYVRLVLAVGQHDGDYVDAYYGPEAWQEAAGAEARSLEEIREQATRLLANLGTEAPTGGDELTGLRWRYLRRQLQAVIARVDLLGGAQWSFDEEAQALYDATPPSYDEAHFQSALDELEQLLAGEGFRDGSLIERYQAFRRDFRIPPAKLDAVFREAIAACRSRTQKYMALPEGETFTVEYVTDKAWSGYNLVPGGLPEPHPSQHRPADLHRPSHRPGLP